MLLVGGVAPRTFALGGKNPHAATDEKNAVCLSVRITRYQPNSSNNTHVRAAF